MQKGDPGIAQYGLRVAVDYRHLQADLTGVARWEGEGAVFSGSLLEIYERANGTLVLSGSRTVRVVLAEHAIANITLRFEGSTPHLSDMHIDVGDGADCTLHSRFVVRGNVRLDTSATLHRSSSFSEVSAIEVMEGVFDGLTRIEHLSPETRSRVTTKVVLVEGVRAVVRAQVVIAKIAKKSRASQRMDALLLGPRAEADLLPTMEVATDDVVCNHAATTVKPDVDEMFYLQSRGLTAADAKRLITAAFLA